MDFLQLIDDLARIALKLLFWGCAALFVLVFIAIRVHPYLVS